jgi:hypothetical protein
VFIPSILAGGIKGVIILMYVVHIVTTLLQIVNRPFNIPPTSSIEINLFPT